MAPGHKRFGRVVERRGAGLQTRFRVDLGANLPGRFIYSVFGQPLASAELAEATLHFIEAQAARGRALADIVAEISPDAPAVSQVEPLMKRWLANFETRVETGRRQPRTLEDYRRWVGDGEGEHAYLAHWFGKALAEIDPASIEEWDLALHRRGLAPKTRRNVMAALHAFLSWVREQRPSYAIPKFPWPELDDRAPTVLTPEVQATVLNAIPWPKRGIFLAMAECMVRPGEARVLRVRDWLPDNQLRVVQAAKDHKTVGVRRSLKARNVKTVPIISYEIFDVTTLNSWLVQHVEAPGRRLSDPDGPLFLNPDGRRDGWWSKSALAYHWAQACAAAGASGVSLYRGTKHTGAVALKQLGLDDRILAQLLGHRDPRSVGFYAKLDSAAVRSVLLRLHGQKP